MRLTPYQQKQILETALKYARRGGTSRTRGGAGGMFHRLGQQFGPFGELLGMVVDILSGTSREPQRRDVEDAIKLLTEHGYRVTPGPTPPPAPGVTEFPEPPPVIVRPTRPVRPGRAAPPPVSTRTRGRVPPRPAAEPGPEEPAAEIWPEEHGVQVLPTRIRGAFEQIPKDVEGLSPWILTPDSSNVFGFLFDYQNGILYVQFRAAAKPTNYKTMVNSCNGKEYKVGIRPNVEGPIYSYGGAGNRIPESKFREFAAAYSAGQWVWQNLRVCGSNFAHRYVYTLTDVPTGQSVPRHATRRGLRTRTVPTVGLGRRRGRLSTLPESIR